MTYNELAEEIANLVNDKQKAYGDSFSQSSKVLEVLYPYGVNPQQYGDLLTITRIIDKLFRIANDKKAFGESPYRDIVGYGLLACKRDEDGNAV